jgi:uncharacterized protein YgiM (DUF1202 family)
MKPTTRQKLLGLMAAFAVAITAAAVATPANAAPGTVTANVNVRSGPGTNYPVVSTVRSGTQVDVQQCQGSWCYVVRSGLTGWVSSSYLAAAATPQRPTNPGPFPGNQGPRPGNPGNPPPYPGNQGPFPGNQGPFPGNNQGNNGPSINLNIPGGPSITIGNGNQNPPPRPQIQPPVVQPPSYDSEVCFYDGSRFRGASTCLSAGDNVRDLGDWTDRISSIDNPDGLNVQVCSEPNYRNCRTYTTSAATLGDFDDYIASVRIR